MAGGVAHVGCHREEACNLQVPSNFYITHSSSNYNIEIENCLI